MIIGFAAESRHDVNDAIREASFLDEFTGTQGR